METRIPATSDATRPRRRAGTAVGFAIAIACVVVLCVWWLRPADNAPRGSDVSPPARAALAVRPDWLRPVPPAVVLYTTDVPDEGVPDTPFADAFTEAMAPWQAGNYAEAALRLDELARAYPGIADAHFYRGAAWLLAGVPDAAVAPLQRSVSLAPPSLSGETRWYLGLALLESGRLDEAARAFEDGCVVGHAAACRAVACAGGGDTTPC